MARANIGNIGNHRVNGMLISLSPLPVLLHCMLWLFRPLLAIILFFIYLITASYGNLATALGFYFNKAKRENTRGGITYDKAMQNDDSENAVG